jgi:hypothetical protein
VSELTSYESFDRPRVPSAYCAMQTLYGSLMSAAFIFRTVRSRTMSHGCDYYLWSVTPAAALRREIMNLGLDLASAHNEHCKVGFC